VGDARSLLPAALEIHSMYRRSPLSRPVPDWADICRPHPGERHLILLGLLLVLVTVALVGGCGGPGDESSPPAAGTSLQGVPLKLLVVGDPQLATAAERLRGEWSAQTGAGFEVAECSAADLLGAGKIEADAVVAPCWALAPLAERQKVAPVPREILAEKSGPWPGIIETLRTRQAVWDGTVHGVPFGSPVMTCYYRADLLKKLGRRPPESWAEYGELAGLLADRDKLGAGVEADSGSQGARPGEQSHFRGDHASRGARRKNGGSPLWCGAIEPLAEGWAGLTLLARAAPAAKHRDNFADLFDPDTMKSLVAGEPFVRALEQLVAASRHGPEEPWRYDPAAARAAFWAGECGMALTWPTGAKQQGLPKTVAPGSEVGFVELPGSHDVYNVATGQWDTRGPESDTRVTLLGVSGRLGLVPAGSGNRQAAFQLLFWLSGEDLSPRFCTASPGTTLFRESHLKKPGPWVESPVDEAAADQYAATLDAALRREHFVFALWIPGRERYLAAMDEAVLAAVRGKSEPAEALQQAAAEWDAVTSQLGVEGQKRAYRRCLGLD
jgi:ABC-type glycerol-3-phosphate transport system substrate-binding protein